MNCSAEFATRLEPVDRRHGVRGLATRTHPASQLFAGALVSLCTVATSMAATVPFTSASTLALYPDVNDLNSLVNTGYSPDVKSGPPSPASQTTTVSGAWGAVSAIAGANLQTGQLKAQAAVTANNYSGFMPYGQTNATFGDGFRATSSGQPFSWLPDSTAKFTMNLSGTLSSSGYTVDGSGTGAFIMMAILRPGTLSPTAFSDADYQLTTDPNVLSYYVYSLGNPGATWYFNGEALTTTLGFTDIPDQITQEFSPGGDFDWWVLLGAAGQVPGPLTSYDFDLAHTMTLDYTGPTGTTTESSSGLFRNFQSTGSVPEPATLALVALGLGGLGFSRRKRWLIQSDQDLCRDFPAS
jgi:hypothetical protein